MVKLKCHKCETEFETSAKFTGTCPTCKKGVHIGKKNIVSIEEGHTAPDAVEQQKSKELNITSFDDILNKFNEKKPQTKEEEVPEGQPQPEQPQSNLADAIQPQLNVVGYVTSFIDILSTQFLDKKEPTKEQYQALIKETMTICSIYLSVAAPEGDVKPIEIPAWGFALATVAVFILPKILKKFTNKKEEDENVE